MTPLFALITTGQSVNWPLTFDTNWFSNVHTHQQMWEIIQSDPLLFKYQLVSNAGNNSTWHFKLSKITQMTLLHIYGVCQMNNSKWYSLISKWILECGIIKFPVSFVIISHIWHQPDDYDGEKIVISQHLTPMFFFKPYDNFHERSVTLISLTLGNSTSDTTCRPLVHIVCRPLFTSIVNTCF